MKINENFRHIYLKNKCLLEQIIFIFFIKKNQCNIELFIFLAFSFDLKFSF